MKQIAKYFMALTLLAMPFAFQSCSEREDISNYYYYDDLVTEAVNNYWYVYPGGTDYDTAYNWFVHYYPNALSLIHISQPTRLRQLSRMPSSA